MPAIKAHELRRARLRRRLKPKQVAEACGISDTHYYNVERGRRPPSLDLLDRLAEVVEVPVEALVVDLEDLGLDPAGAERGSA